MDVISVKQLEAVFRKIENNTKAMVDASAADERASASLEVMEIIFSASMGFDIMIRMFGIDQGIDTEAAEWHRWLLANVVWVPGAWFCMNMFWTFLICYTLKQYMGWLGEQATNFVQVERILKMPMDPEELENYLSTKSIEVSGGDEARNTSVTTWTEEDEEIWGGAPPKITLTYDKINAYILTARLDVDKKKVELPEEVDDTIDVESWVSSKLIEVLREQNVLFPEGQDGRPKKLGGMLG
jgi:hypothetical protein